MLKILTAKEAFDVDSRALYNEAINFLGLPKDASLKVHTLYNFENLTAEELEVVEDQVFDKGKFDISDDLSNFSKDKAYRYRQVTGQYNEQEQMLEEMVQHLLGYTDAKVHQSYLVEHEGLSQDEIEKLKDYQLNPVELVEVALDFQPKAIQASATDDLLPVEGFTEMSESQLADYAANFSMDLDDMLVCQNYFQEIGRQPNTTELNVIDTYWSDHCRHTTFNTHIDDVEIVEGKYQALFNKALQDYLSMRKDLDREDRAISLMDLGTIRAKQAKADGVLSNVEVSAEVNACALDIKVDVDGKDEDWVLYFKNETHNHPTEIEPFGGASTCVGGGVRDPLSGRSWVYQAFRISGASNPTQDVAETHPDKLPQRVISRKALEGNSDYANKIGVTAGFAEEIYHPGFEAKRLELGALIAAAPRENVVRLEPQAGDQIVLLGGDTGRDGLGAAVGSSQVQTNESLEDSGAEVQKGAAAIERKIMRLFRNSECTKLIKRCNDFGAGGVAVAVGELTDGLTIDLDEVPVKYPGMHGGEIALSESQERMAVVVAKEDLDAFLAFAKEEDVSYAVIAEVTDDARMQMTWKGETIIDLHRDFLDSNGAEKHARVKLVQPQSIFVNDVDENISWDADRVEAYMSSLSRADQHAMAGQFDGSINKSTVLNPYGGKTRRTKELGMVSKLPVEDGLTTTTSGMAYGYHPDLAEQSPFHGGYYAVVESISRMVALGFDYKDIRLTFQEFFERLGNDPERWGKPFLSLLGANQAMIGLETGSIGGKDSMSGSFEDIDVPPTLISFAVAQGKTNLLMSRAFKQAGSQVLLLENPITDEGTIDLDQAKTTFEALHQAVAKGQVLSISTVGFNGMLKEIVEMSYGNFIGIQVKEEMTDRLAQPMMGSFIVELAADQTTDHVFANLDAQFLGQTVEGKIVISGQDISIERVLEASQAVLADVFDQVEMSQQEPIEATSKAFQGQTDESNPKALIPVLFGVNGEYDMDFALSQAGFETQQVVLADSSHENYEQSVAEFAQALKESQVLALSSGAVFGDSPQELGRAWELLLNHDQVKPVIEEHLNKGRLIIGAGSGFAALIRTGLIEHGQITNESSVRLLPNPKGRYISDILTGQVVSEHSVYSKDQVGQSYTAPVATDYGRVDLGQAADTMKDQGQVISCFGDYFAEENIDALTSPNGLIFGSVSNFERVDADLYRNVVDSAQVPFLNQARQYFN